MSEQTTKNTHSISISELELNINIAMLDYCKYHGKLPTAAFVNLKLFKIFFENELIEKKAGAKKTEKGVFPEFIFKDYVGTDVYTHGEIYKRYKEYGLKSLKNAKNMEFPLTLCMHKRLFNGFKKLACYNIGVPTEDLIQAL